MRDYCLGRPNQDLDFAVDRDAVKFARAFAGEIRGAYVLLDEDHGCARVVKKHQGRVLTYDFADFRAPSIEDDIAHRDFTINTLIADARALKAGDGLDGAIVDVRRARKDILKRTIRRVSVRSLREDPLRIMRAFALKAALDFRIDLSTLNQIRREKASLRDVSAERVRDELFKILESPRAAATLIDMDKHGVLAEVIPQIRIMEDCPQGGYHHLAVWPHSLETVRQFELICRIKDDGECGSYLDAPIAGNRSRRALIKLGALLHDIGKPDTRKKEGEKYSFHGHEHAGAGIARIIASQLKLSTKESRVLEDMVRWHLRPGYLSNFKRPSEKAYFRYFRDTKDEAAGIALLSLADQRSTRGPLTTPADQEHHEAVCREIIRRYFIKSKERPLEPLITGHDLIKNLKLKPSPLFGKVLSGVREQQALGAVTDKAGAIKLARKLAGV